MKQFFQLRELHGNGETEEPPEREGVAMTKSMSFVMLLLCSSSGALAANKAGADACATRLDASAQQIYAAVAPRVTVSSDVKSLIVDTVKPMVMSGKMTRDAAQVAAASAGDCLTLLK